MNGTPHPVDLPIGALLGEAWDIFKNNAGILIGGTVIMLVIMGAASSTAAGIVVNGPLYLGYTAMIFAACRKQPVTIEMLFSGFQKFVPAMVAMILISIFISVGFCLCILPGLFLTMCYMMVFYYMLDKNLDFWPAMEASRIAVMANIGPWLLLLLVIIGLEFAGLLLCGLGWLVTYPLTSLMVALAYIRTEGVPATTAPAAPAPTPAP